MKAIELVTCIGGGYYAGCNFQIMLLEYACQVITAHESSHILLNIQFEK